MDVLSLLSIYIYIDFFEYNFSYAFFFLSILYCIDIISRLKNSALKIPFLHGTVVSWSTIFLIKLDWMFGYPATSPLPQQPQWFGKAHLTSGLTTSRLHYATNYTPYTTGRIQLSFWRMYNCLNVAQFLFMIWPWMLGNVYAATPRPMERFENANIFIFPTFQETVGSHLLMVVMPTLCYGNNLIQTFFVVSVKNSLLAKISQYIVYIHDVISTPSWWILLKED